jgi:hypothetical protein
MESALRGIIELDSNPDYREALVQAHYRHLNPKIEHAYHLCSAALDNGRDSRADSALKLFQEFVQSVEYIKYAHKYLKT